MQPCGQAHRNWPNRTGYLIQEIVHTIALGAVRSGQAVKNVLYTAAGEKGPTWSLWQKAAGETRG